MINSQSSCSDPTSSYVRTREGGLVSRVKVDGGSMSNEPPYAPSEIEFPFEDVRENQLRFAEGLASDVSWMDGSSSE